MILEVFPNFNGSKIIFKHIKGNYTPACDP